jgi:hypothetical protein
MSSKSPKANSAGDISLPLYLSLTLLHRTVEGGYFTAADLLQPWRDDSLSYQILVTGF